MAKLTYKERKNLPDSDFALPKKRKYPIYDKAHARNALARVAQEPSRKNISATEAAIVKRKGCKVLSEGKVELSACLKRNGARK